MEKTRLDLMNSGACYLSNQGVINALGESEIFLSHLLNCARAQLYLDNLNTDCRISDIFWWLLKKRGKGIPLQYLIGSVEFMGLNFKVRAGVFIPRPETEILVDFIINHSPFTRYHSPNVLDIGAGCGNIAISLAKRLKGASVFACDISESALQLTQENALAHQADVRLFQADLFGGLRKKDFFSLIVSNPPYIKSADIFNLPVELAYEPKQALDGATDGLAYYRAIVCQAADYLDREGFLAFELGDGQADYVAELLGNTGRFASIEKIRDYNGIERVIIARKTK